MSTSRFGRRSFLGGSINLGLGAAVTAITGGGLDLLDLPGAAASETRREAALSAASGNPSSLTLPPPEPPGAWSFVSRPDLKPPGVTIAKAAGFGVSPLTPRCIFAAPSGSVAGSQSGLMILDLNGDLIWFKPLTGGDESPLNFRVQTYKGHSVLTWFQGTIGVGYGIGGTCVVMNSSYDQVAAVTAKNYPTDLHEFLLTPEGTALITAYEPTSSIVIGHAQELDVASGDLVFDWPCHPAVSPSESYTGSTGDYFHINSIDLWPGAERNLLISGRNCCAVYLVERSTKKVLWRLHGKKSDFTTNGSTQFWFQHDARALADGSGLSLFDDASQPCPEKQSWGKVMTLDQRTKTTIIRSEYRHTTALLDPGSQGNCQLLPTGGHFIGWGAEPYFSEFLPTGSELQGALVLDGRFPTGIITYRSFTFDWVGSPPMSELNLAVLPGAATGEFIAFASWNGATNVASWQVEVGTSPSSLASYAIVPKNGFETSIPLTYSGATSFRVLGINSQGRVIGQSQVVSPT